MMFADRRRGDVGGPALPLLYDIAHGTATSRSHGSGILILFGICVVLRGLRKNEKISGPWSLRGPDFFALSIVVRDSDDLAVSSPTLAALVFISAASGREFRLVEVLALLAVLGALSVALSVWGLGLPYPLVKGIS